LFVQKVLPHFLHVVFRSKPFSPVFIDVAASWSFGKLMAFLWHMGSHAVQPLTHLWGFATTAFPFIRANTPLEQYSTHRGFPNDAHPSHFSGKIVGYQDVQALAMRVSRFRFHSFEAVITVLCTKVC